MNTLWLIVGCGVLAIVYGIWAIQSVLSADAGSAKMQEISNAVREGAQAYLKRQYTTIGIVGVVIFILLGFTLGAVGDRPQLVVEHAAVNDDLAYPRRQFANRLQVKSSSLFVRVSSVVLKQTVEDR